MCTLLTIPFKAHNNLLYPIVNDISVELQIPKKKDFFCNFFIQSQVVIKRFSKCVVS